MHAYAGVSSPGQWLQVRHGLALVGVRLGVSFSINWLNVLEDGINQRRV